MISTAYETATYPRSLEVWAYVDADDPEYGDYISDYDCAPARFISGERRLLSECWNVCAKAAFLRGSEIVMHGGDDIVFTTPGWDVQVRDAFAASEDKILLVQGDDLSPNRHVLARTGFCTAAGSKPSGTSFRRCSHATGTTCGSPRSQTRSAVASCSRS
jgi:hypothetical protein